MVLLATAKNGAPVINSPYQRDMFKKFLRDNEGKGIRIKVEVYKGKATDEQRGFYFAAVVPWFASKHPKMTEDDAHDTLKQYFNGRFIELANGVRLKLGKTTSRMSSTEYSDYIMRIHEWATENGYTDWPDSSDYKKDRDTNV